jgi:trehalose 6-phosphate synthase/phosphatase
MVSLLRAFEDLNLPIRWFSPANQPIEDFPPAVLKAHTEGFSNQTLWPLCHQVHQSPTYIRSEWDSYEEINQRMARTLMRALEGGVLAAPILLVHDYHFARLPHWLGQLGFPFRIGFFWHVPWPSVEQFQTLPWAREIAHSLASCDTIGFHTRGDVDRYHAALDLFLGDQGRRNGQVIPAGPQLPSKKSDSLRHFHAVRPAWFLTLGIDRMDYTKGLLQKFRAVDLLLERRPELRGRFQLLQIACPTRERLPAYAEHATQVRRLAHDINRKWLAGIGRGRPPIQLVERVLDQQKMESLHRRADLALITPLHDGMNLVAKEHVLYHEAGPGRAGALVLSQFAGAADELKDAFLVHPFSPDSIADGIERALNTPLPERLLRMQRLKAQVQANPSSHWARSLLKFTQDSQLGAPSWYESARAATATRPKTETPESRRPHHRLRALPAPADALPQNRRAKAQSLPE